MVKKGISLILTATIFLFCFSGITHAATSPKYPLRPTVAGQWGQVSVHLGGGATRFSLTVDQKGIHSGQKAHTYWEIYHENTGVTEHTRDIPGDFYGAILFSGLKNPGGNYEVIWESKTNNDTEGYYLISTPSSYSEFYHRR